MNKFTPLVTSLVDAPPPRMTEGEKRLVKGEQGDLRRPKGEGGRSRAAEARRRGWPEEREGERHLGGRPYGEQRGVVREGGSDLVRAGDIFLGERSGTGR